MHPILSLPGPPLWASSEAVGCTVKQDAPSYRTAVSFCLPELACCFVLGQVCFSGLVVCQYPLKPGSSLSAL